MLPPSKLGHIAIKCYHKFDLNITGTNISQNNNYTTCQANNPNQNSQAYFVSPKIVNDPSWYMGSGPTNHVTSYLNGLSLKNDYKGKGKLIIGNGQNLSISHIGY